MPTRLLRTLAAAALTFFTMLGSAHAELRILNLDLVLGQTTYEQAINVFNAMGSQHRGSVEGEDLRPTWFLHVEQPKTGLKYSDDMVLSFCDRKILCSVTIHLKPNSFDETYKYLEKLYVPMEKLIVGESFKAGRHFKGHTQIMLVHQKLRDETEDHLQFLTEAWLYRYADFPSDDL